MAVLKWLQKVKSESEALWQEAGEEIKH